MLTKSTYLRDLITACNWLQITYLNTIKRVPFYRMSVVIQSNLRSVLQNNIENTYVVKRVCHIISRSLP